MSSDETRFDFVVVGGGSGGNVVATRLVEAGHRVLLLEAGKNDRHPYIKMPAGLFMLGKTGHLITHETPVQPSANGRTMYIPTGATLGGGSSVNGMIYIRGQKEDYDAWRDMGHRGWAWSDVLPYFLRAENNQRLSGEDHGGDVLLPPTFSDVRTRCLFANRLEAHPLNEGLHFKELWAGRRSASNPRRLALNG